MKLLVSLLLFVVAISAQTNDPFLQLRHDKLHDSPAQQQFRRLAPMPAGVVYIQQPSEGEREMREHFRTMKRLGFNALRQIMPRCRRGRWSRFNCLHSMKASLRGGTAKEVALDDFQYSGVNRTLKIGDAVLDGFVAAMTPTSAKRSCFKNDADHFGRSSQADE